MRAPRRPAAATPVSLQTYTGTISCYNSLHIYFRRSGGCSESGKKGRGRNRNKSLRSGKLNRRGIFAFSDFRSKPSTATGSALEPCHTTRGNTGTGPPLLCTCRRSHESLLELDTPRSHAGYCASVWVQRTVDPAAS